MMDDRMWMGNQAGSKYLAFVDGLMFGGLISKVVADELISRAKDYGDSLLWERMTASAQQNTASSTGQVSQ